jgi:tetratricopeptide (TPR) repeat protein
MIPGAGLKLTIYLGMIFCRGVALSDPNGITPAVNQSEAIRQQVESQRVSAMEPNQPGQSNVLRQVIAQLESLRWSGEYAATYPGAVVKKPKEEKTQTAAVAAEQSPSSAVLQPVSAESRQNDTPRISSLDKVDKPVNVLAAADALYQAKDYKRAMRFYQMAIELKPQNDPTGRQWAMYQAANCMQRQTPDQAVQCYDRLLAEYPGSPWASAALAQRKNLDWLKQNQTLLLKSMASNDPNQQ